jgi:hypothetical protein
MVIAAAAFVMLFRLGWGMVWTLAACTAAGAAYVMVAGDR